MNNHVRADELTAKYIALRDFKDKVSAELKEKLDRVDSALSEIESSMMTFLNQTGQESCKTEKGTFFKKTSTSAKVADRDVFLHFVMENEAINFLENRVNKIAVEEYITEHGEVPPGVDVLRVVQVSVHRPKTR